MSFSSFRRGVLVFLLLIGSTGCSGFNRAWDDWEQPAVSARSAAVLGRWQGRWHSDANGHEGELRCIVSHDETQDRYQAWFKAEYGLFFSFSYTMDLEVTPRPDGEGYLVGGEEDLGAMAGGLYQYQGSIVGDRFRCEFEAEKDHGTYTMTRVPDEP